MRGVLRRLILPLLAGTVLAGCITGEGMDPTAPIVPLIDVAERKAELATLERRGEYCSDFARGRPFLERRATIRGRFMYQQSNAQHAGIVLLNLIEAYYGGGPRVAEVIRNTLVEGARIDAFTVIAPYVPSEVPGYNAMNEPVFQVANFMLALAHAYLVLKEEYPEDKALLMDIRRWGNRLFRVTSGGNDDFLGVSGGADRRAVIAAGWASWGNVANNRTALALAYRYYIHALSSIGRGGADRVWGAESVIGPPLLFSTLTVGSALVAAHALHRSGADDVYTVAPGGGTIVEGAAWLWNMIQKEQSLELLHARNSGGRGLGWAELFLREFPHHPLAADIEARLAPQRPLYLEMGGGGPTTCLYRRIPPPS